MEQQNIGLTEVKAIEISSNGHFCLNHGRKNIVAKGKKATLPAFFFSHIVFKLCSPDWPKVKAIADNSVHQTGPR